MKETHQRQFKGVWIKAEIWENRDLSWLEKCLLAEIDCLDHPQNGCTASNEYLAEMFGSSTASIANMISKLRRLGFVHNVAFDGRRRTMRVKAPLTTQLMPDELHSEPGLNGLVNAEAVPYKGERIGKKIEENTTLSAPQKTSLELTEKKSADHKRFIELWTVAFLKHFGFPYRFDGAKDGKAVKTLLATTRKTPEELLEMAAKAWARRDYPFSSAATIAGFNSRLNEIQVKLSIGNGKRRIESRESQVDIRVEVL